MPVSDWASQPSFLEGFLLPSFLEMHKNGARSYIFIQGDSDDISDEANIEITGKNISGVINVANAYHFYADLWLSKSTIVLKISEDLHSTLFKTNNPSSLDFHY